MLIINQLTKVRLIASSMTLSQSFCTIRTHIRGEYIRETHKTHLNSSVLRTKTNGHQSLVYCFPGQLCKMLSPHTLYH